MREDPALELAQGSCGLDPELVHQEFAPPAIDGEGISLPSGPVERHHQLSSKSLAKRMLCDELLQLRHELRVTAERELCVEAPFDRPQTNLVESLDRRLRERLRCEVGERRAPPEGERFT